MILQALNGYYERVAASGTGDIAPYGYAYAPISFALVINPQGNLVAVDDLREQLGRTLRPKSLLVPRDMDDRTSGIEPRAFWDKTAYVLGVSATSKRADREHSSFKKRQSELFTDSDDVGLVAMLRFLAQWRPEAILDIAQSQDMMDQNLIFRLDGILKFVHETEAARNIWDSAAALATGSPMTCLVTGVQQAASRLHPLIKNIARPGQPIPKLVAFDKGSDAFESYGKEQGANAPVSEAAAFAYTTALNALLTRTSGRDTKDRPIYRNRVQIGDATTVYWAEAGAPDQAVSAEDLMAAIFSPPGDTPSDDDQSATAKLGDVIKKMADGQPIEQAASNLAGDTKFFVLGLSPNAARISVRFWHVTTLGELGRAFQLHWQDLKIDGPGSPRPPAIWQLVSRIAPARRNAQGVVKYDTKNVPPNLAGEMMRAILSGGAYPRTLINNIVMRFRTDHEIDRLRIAMLKAGLVRDMRRANPTLPKETNVSLNRDDPDPAYRLGRLFAILEKTQRAAMDGVNSTICDRYYGAASATPQRVFAFLIKNSKNHLASLRKGRGAKWVKKPAATGGWLDRQIGEIYEPFAGTIPATLTLEAQSRFAIGYYHEKYAKRDDAPEDLKSPEPETVSELSDDADAKAND